MKIYLQLLSAILFCLFTEIICGLGSEAVFIGEVEDNEDIATYINHRLDRSEQQGFHQFRQEYLQIMGAANPFKEGDQTIGVAAKDESSRENARKLILNTKISFIHEHPLHVDNLQKLIWENIDQQSYNNIKNLTIRELKNLILEVNQIGSDKKQSESLKRVKDLMSGLDPHVIAALVKTMSNDELGVVGKTIYNPTPLDNIGGPNYFGARIQPNSPTDNPEDIAWQVFDGFSYAVGDVVIGVNSVDSTVESVAQIELKLKDIVETFEKTVGEKNLIPWSVLAHIDVQAAVEKKYPGSTLMWFQSLGGNDATNKTFDLSLQKLLDYSLEISNKKTPYSFYFETGQGSEFTNGHGDGVDMVVLESNKYALARVLNKIASKNEKKMMIVNDVSGFIGPEVFQTSEQLLRTILEDTAMGKLNGLFIGLDVCSTLHMSVTLDQLEQIQDNIMTLSNPAYMMALPTRSDPMLSYLTTSFQDHVRIREKFHDKFHYKMSDRMWKFYQWLEVIDQNGKPTSHFGDPRWVYFKYMKAKGDTRSQEDIYLEGAEQMLQVTSRGVMLAEGYGEHYWDLKSDLDKLVHDLYEDAKISLWTELDQKFVDKNIPNVILLKTKSVDRKDYILHPTTGEQLDDDSVQKIKALRDSRQTKESTESNADVQIVISDGLNAKAIMDDEHLVPFLEKLREELTEQGLSVYRENLVVRGGRVRAGYQIGHLLFGDSYKSSNNKAVIHIIGERPGTMHHAFSAYIVSTSGAVWAKTGEEKGKVDHDIAKLVSGISDTSLHPEDAARETVQLLQEIRQKMKARASEEQLEKWILQKTIATTENNWSELVDGVEVGGSPLVIGLGESDHGLHEFPIIRNHFFKYLVENKGFKTIVLETGILEALLVEQYIHQKSGDHTISLQSVLREGFTHNMGEWQESLELVEWMRNYNQQQFDDINKIHFYGIDLTTLGDAPILALMELKKYLPQIQLDATLLSLAKKVSCITEQMEKAYQVFLKNPNIHIDPDLLDAYGTIGFDQLSLSEKDQLESLIKDLKTKVKEMMSGKEDPIPLHLVTIAQQMIDDLRSRDAYPKIAFFDTAIKHLSKAGLGDGLIINKNRLIDMNSAEELKIYFKGREAREKALADNLLWVEQQFGKTLIYAHNGHLMKTATDTVVGDVHVGKSDSKGAGEFIAEYFGKNYLLIGGTMDKFLGDNAVATESCQNCLEKTLRLFPGNDDVLLLDLRAGKMDNDIFPLLNQDRPFRWQKDFQKMNVVQAFDALFFIRTVTLAHPILQ